MTKLSLFRAFKLFSAAMLVLIAVGGATCTPTLETLFGPKEAIMIAFADDSGRIRVRISPDGTTWTTQDFPANHVCVPGACEGVAGGSDSNANFFGVAYQLGTNVLFVQGLWGAAWETRAQVPPSHPLASAPSIAHIGSDRWAVAFRRSDGTITVSVLDTGEDAFVVADVAPLGSPNSSVNGRPAIASFGNTVVLAWSRRLSGGGLQLVASVGTISGAYESETLSFQSPTTIPLPRTAELSAGMFGFPALARDADNFYIAVVREETGGGAGTLHGWQAFVLSSANGTSWSAHSSTRSLGVVNTSIVQIGGMTDGTLVMAAISPRTSDHGSAARFASGASGWTSLSRDAVFGSFRPAAKGFALSGVGRTP